MCTNAFLTNSFIYDKRPKPVSHMAVDIFTSSAEENPILQIDSYSFSKKNDILKVF